MPSNARHSANVTTGYCYLLCAHTQFHSIEQERPGKLLFLLLLLLLLLRLLLLRESIHRKSTKAHGPSHLLSAFIFFIFLPLLHFGLHVSVRIVRRRRRRFSLAVFWLITTFQLSSAQLVSRRRRCRHRFATNRAAEKYKIQQKWERREETRKEINCSFALLLSSRRLRSDGRLASYPLFLFFTASTNRKRGQQHSLTH